METALPLRGEKNYIFIIVVNVRGRKIVIALHVRHRKELTMTVTKDRVVSIDYNLKDSEGQLIDSSRTANRSSISTATTISSRGSKNTSRAKGPAIRSIASFLRPKATASATRASYSRLTRANSEQDAQVEVGMQFEAHGEEGTQIVTVVGIANNEITIDAEPSALTLAASNVLQLPDLHAFTRIVTSLVLCRPVLE